MATCHPWRRCMTVPTPFWARRPSTSPSSRVPRMRWFPPAASSRATCLTWPPCCHVGAAGCRSQLGSWGYLPGFQLTIPAHPQHCHMLVRGLRHMVGRPLCPHAGAGQVGTSQPLHLPQWRHLLLLHLPQWRHLLLLHFPLWSHILHLHFTQRRPVLRRRSQSEPVLFGWSRSQCEDVKAKTPFLLLFSLFLYEKEPEPVKKKYLEPEPVKKGPAPQHWWRHHHPSWCSLGGHTAPPGGSVSRTSGRSHHHRLHAPSQKPFSPARLLGF